MSSWDEARFIGAPIDVEFNTPPLIAKRPPCPDRFVWEGETYPIDRLIREWHDYGRRGRMASNMRPEHLARAKQRGSWGVGRYYFQVQARGRVFELYYDRAPKDVDDRTGSWYLYRELLTR